MRYAMLLRGINVGANHPVKMPDLEHLLTELGFSGVQTYIRSGNVLLDATMDEAALRQITTAAFSQRFGFESSLVIRNAAEMRAIAENLPFSPEEIARAEAADPAVEHIYVYFLDRPPEQAQFDALFAQREPGDEIRCGIREIYLLCSRSIRLSKTAALTAKKFPSATARNWNTVVKLNEMLLEG